jgi:hypothetical protein
LSQIDLPKASKTPLSQPINYFLRVKRESLSELTADASIQYDEEEHQT